MVWRGYLARHWWEDRRLLFGMVIAAAVPLLWPQIPPLVDLPGHIGRYRVELGLSSSPALQRYFEFHWALMGNLGVDLLVIPLEPLFGLELAVKVIVIAIPVLTVVGIFWVAQELHGRVPPTTFFAIPFVYGFSFNFGFVNYSLSVALALIGFALWLRLQDHSRALVTAIFVPVSLAIWTVHAFGWGLLGLLVWSLELVRCRDEGRSWTKSAGHATLVSACLAPPLILMLMWRSGDAAGATAYFFGVGLKALALLSALRDRWVIWDSFSVAAAIVLLASAVFDKHLEFSRKLGVPLAVLLAMFLLMPRLVFGSNFADMRLSPLLFIVAIIALRPRESLNDRSLQLIAVLGMAFVVIRLGGNTISFGVADRQTRAELKALDHISNGAAVLSLVGDTCGNEWSMLRHAHLGSMVIVRKNGFSNDQWDLPGAQLLRVKYQAAGEFTADPSEMTVSLKCRAEAFARIGNTKDRWLKNYVESTHRTADQALRQFPRNAFDYVWLIRPEGFSAPPPADLRLIWAGPHSSLFQVLRST